MRIMLVSMISLAAACAGAATRPTAATTVAIDVAIPTGDMHDFDYFAGAWNTRQHRLKTRGAGSNDWEDFPGTLCMNPYLGGMVTMDELEFPTKGWSGATLRVFDLATRRWSIYWISSKTGRLDAPVVGGFTGDRGEFYGDDVDAGRPVKVRYAWTKIDRDHAHWEQAFSYDGRTWEVNWTAEFLRGDPAALCDAGRPRRAQAGPMRGCAKLARLEGQHGLCTQCSSTSDDRERRAAVCSLRPRLLAQARCGGRLSA